MDSEQADIPPGQTKENHTMNLIDKHGEDQNWRWLDKRRDYGLKKHRKCSPIELMNYFERLGVDQ